MEMICSSEDLFLLQNSYFRGVARQEEKNLTQTTSEMNGTDTIERNSMNSFLNYCNNAAILLKTSLYQLSPTIGKRRKVHTI